MNAATAIERADAILPGVVSPPILTRMKGVFPWAILAVAIVFITIDLNLTPDTFFRGVRRLGVFFSTMWPPTADGHFLRIVNALVETFAMAFAGTAIAVLAAIPLGLIGAKTILSFGPAHFIIRRIYDFFRGIPALVWALVFVSAFGLGPFAGVIALAFADTPVLAKLYAEALENIDEAPGEGLRASGVGRARSLRFAALPQVLPVGLSQALYYLESNFRNAAVLGIVGAGGIGFELEERIRVFAFDQVAFIIILYMLCVAGLDAVSAKIRTQLV